MMEGNGSGVFPRISVETCNPVGDSQHQTCSQMLKIFQMVLRRDWLWVAFTLPKALGPPVEGDFVVDTVAVCFLFSEI